MSSFDTISRGKKRPVETKKNNEKIVKKNSGKKVYRDIHKYREKTLIIKPLKKLERIKKTSAEEKIFRIQDEIKRFGNSLKKRQIGIIVLVLFLSFIVYGVGFVLRTEKSIKNIVTAPEKYYSIDTISDTLFTLWQDYQILGLIADNSPIAIEPLTSYGKILRNTRLLVAQSKNIQKMTNEIIGWKNTAKKESIFPLLDKLWNIMEDGERNLEILSKSLSKISPPEQAVQEKYNRYMKYLDTFLREKEIWYNLLGKRGPTKIMILNQNNDELRAGGGFPGTVFLIDFENGKITNIAFHDIYELDYSIKEYITPPKGIDQFNSILFPGKPVEFRMRDANYFPTFAESVQKINQLASLSKIGPVDVIIGINTGILADIIHIIGPLKIKGVPMKLHEENISLVLSMLVEAKESLHGVPKGIIHILGDSIFDTVIEKNKTAEVLKILWKNLENGEILVASPRKDVQKAIENLHIFDTWKTSQISFIYPIFTSIGRNKSDRIMTRNITIKEINDCKREVILNQKHGWNVDKESHIKKMAYDLNIVDKIPLLLPIQGKSDNKQYIRFILPQGSILDTKTKKMQLKPLITDNSEVILDGYITTPMGKSSSVHFSYTLPPNLCGTETLFFKQAGLKNLTVTIERNGEIFSEKTF